MYLGCFCHSIKINNNKRLSVMIIEYKTINTRPT